MHNNTLIVPQQIDTQCSHKITRHFWENKIQIPKLFIIIVKHGKFTQTVKL